MAKAEEMMENLKTGNLSLYGELVTESAAQTLELMENICLQRDRKKTLEEKEAAAWTLAAERAK